MPWAGVVVNVQLGDEWDEVNGYDTFAPDDGTFASEIDNDTDETYETVLSPLIFVDVDEAAMTSFFLNVVDHGQVFGSTSD
jgi:hypothetical protein